MKKFFTWICGGSEIQHQLSLVQQTLNVVQGKLLEQEKHIFTLQSKIDTLRGETELSTKGIQKSIQIQSQNFRTVDTHISRVENFLRGSMSVNEENDIEKQTIDDGVPVTDDMRIPIVSGMKVRFETEGIETEIPIV